MSPQEIIDALSYNTGTFPRAAMEAALADPAAITPLLLEELERVASDSQALVAESDSYIRHIFAMYLLAQFRESRAFAPLQRICRLPYEDLEYLLEDTLTEGLPSILASVCGGDIVPLKAIFEDQDLDEFVRNTGLSALLVLVAEGALGREDVVAYLRELSSTLPPDSPVWSHWAYAADVLYPEELLPELDAAFKAERIDPMWISMEDIEYSLHLGRERALQDLPRQHHYVHDAIAEMEKWACFQKTDDARMYDYATPDGFPYPIQLPYFRDAPKIGRNDPCPCGSGKKYKKCCMPV